MKKIISIAAATLVLAAVATTVFAQQPSNGKITGMTENLSLGYSAAQTDTVDLGEVSPQDKRCEYIYLYDNMFAWDTPATNAESTLLTSSQIRAAKLTVRSSNSKVIKEARVNSSKSRIEIEFINEYASVKELDFSMDITLSIDGKQQRDYSMNFSGTLANPVIDISKDDGPVDISDGSVVEATESISKAELALGCGVTVKMRLSQNKKYYGIASNTPSSSDDETMTKHKNIEEVINLKTINIKGSGVTVQFDSAYSNYYVYDADLKYLGKVGESLPFADKYFLASAKLDISEESNDITEATEVTLATNQQQSLPDEAPQNANANPGTGR